MTEKVNNFVVNLSRAARGSLLEKKSIELPHVTQSLKRCPYTFQIIFLIVNSLVACLFCWRFGVSFFLGKDSLDPNNGLNTFACFPDMKKGLQRWCVFILFELCAIADVVNCLWYLMKLACSSSQSSPRYTFLASISSLWLQKISLGCADSSSSNIIFNFSSFQAGVGSVVTIACFFLTFLLFLTEWNLVCSESFKKNFKSILKGLSALLQAFNFVVSLVVWIENVGSMTFKSELTRWLVLILLPFWWLIRLIEYILNVLVYNEEEDSRIPGVELSKREYTPAVQYFFPKPEKAD